MERTEVIKFAIAECKGKIDSYDIPFFFNLFSMVYAAGVESQQPKLKGRIRVFIGRTSYVCDDVDSVWKKYGYSKQQVIKHLKTGIPTKRGHVFKYE